MRSIKTRVGEPVSTTLVYNYFETLVNRFFKILPMWEDYEPSLPVYISSLQVELLGCKEFLPEMAENPQFLSMLCILEHFANTEDLTKEVVKRETFRAISLCNKVKKKYV